MLATSLAIRDTYLARILYVYAATKSFQRIEFLFPTIECLLEL